MAKVRLGTRSGFFEKAEGFMFSGRKNFSSKATFVGVITLGALGAVGVTTSILAPELVGQERNGYGRPLLGTFAAATSYGMYKAADDMARTWYMED